MVVFIADRTVTHPEARFARVKDCLRTQCKRARLTMNWFERTCRSENCTETAQNGPRNLLGAGLNGIGWVETY